MKRVVRTVIVFLLLGAIFNIAVAWAIYFIPGLLAVGYSEKEICPAAADAMWMSLRPDEWSQPWDMAIRMRSLTFAYDVVGMSPMPHGSSWQSRVVSAYYCGFPMRTVAASGYFEKSPNGLRGEATYFIVWNEKDGTAMLPYRPLLLGFTVNTAFYALVLWLPFFGIGVLRRRRRIRRGLCPSCTYPMGTSGVCTECGRELPKRAGGG